MQMLLNGKENIVKDTPQHFSSFLLQTRAKLQNLRQLIITTGLEEKNEQKQPLLHLSTFAMTSAYTWVCLAKAEGIRDTKFLLGISVDARRRLEAPIPGNYFGNCMGLSCTGCGEKWAVGGRWGGCGREGLWWSYNKFGWSYGVLSWAENWLPLVFAK